MKELLSALCFALTMTTTALAGDQGAAAESATRDWLSSVDASEYATSWRDAGALFRKQLTPEAWAQAVSSVRKPLGILRSREVKDVRYATSLPGVPDGEYVVFRFDSAFANKAAAIETVTAVSEEGVWRVAFFSCGRPDQDLFEVRSGIPAKDALETASCFLSTIVGQVYEMAQEIDSSEAHSAAYLLEMVKGIVDSVTASMAEAASNVAQPRMEVRAESPQSAG